MFLSEDKSNKKRSKFTSLAIKFRWEVNGLNLTFQY